MQVRVSEGGGEKDRKMKLMVMLSDRDGIQCSWILDPPGLKFRKTEE